MYNTNKRCMTCGHKLKLTRLESYWCETCWEYKDLDIMVIQDVF